MARVDASVRVTVAIMAGKTAAMDAAAARVLAAAKSAIAPHFETGAYSRSLHIETVPGIAGTGRLVSDRLVVADDPGAAAIEFGHIYRYPNGRRVRFVPGLHIMRKALAAV